MKMKTTLVYLIIISVLFQSCYSYKTIDIKESSLVVGKKYKIRQDTKFVKVKLELVNDSTITVKGGNIREDIPISKIKEIKEAKFSTLKTIGFAIGIGYLIAGAGIVV